MPADKITCLIRAFDPEPGAFGLYQGAELKIFRAMPADIRGNKPGEVVGLGRDGLVVSCGDGRAVVVREVQAQGKKRMSAEEYLHGSRMTSGAVLE
jgi:methionyl-tRNA formyltransferase